MQATTSSISACSIRGEPKIRKGSSIASDDACMGQPGRRMIAAIIISPEKAGSDVLSIILSANNEAAVLSTLLPQLRAPDPAAEILGSDAGSTDDTRELCAR